MARQAADLRVIAEEVALIAVVEGKRMLGPSAGSGALADVCLKFVARQVDCVELEKFCRARLVGAGKVVMIAYFVADVCAGCQLNNTSMAARELDPAAKGIGIIDTLGGPQEMLCVNESGLYDLAMRSRKPEARLFRKWITLEVLPESTPPRCAGPPASSSVTSPASTPPGRILTN